MRKKWITIHGVMINTDNVNTIKIIRNGNIRNDNTYELIITFIDGIKQSFTTTSDEEFMKWRIQLNEK